ncbi:hypothetical protein TRV_05296 [Trichophyton verrucosum HKI 0517]|uniref:Uncharacterized protein n=1 Tax=Trichophyton verrucosum (strain HKI 0517) TaxID=663202 RepID=D4DDT4_TRIVH|nr:uncharacterized protein TRV_05296 [Trichophyton verrucosum HKI 0517]EFE40001.1 hypothetical protein TRV_05296 [Trichophyton verrucosum HKI 0517]
MEARYCLEADGGRTEAAAAIGLGSANISTPIHRMPMATTMGAAAGIFAIFFLGDVPRIREDILMNIPVIGSYWDRSIAPEDNVRLFPIPWPLLILTFTLFLFDADDLMFQ